MEKSARDKRRLHKDSDSSFACVLEDNPKRSIGIFASLREMCSSRSHAKAQRREAVTAFAPFAYQISNLISQA